MKPMVEMQIHTKHDLLIVEKGCGCRSNLGRSNFQSSPESRGENCSRKKAALRCVATWC